MSKRILALLFVVLMIVSLALTGCSSEKSDDEKRRENASAGETAYTISIWVPTNSDSADAKFNERLEAVETAINANLSTDNTRVDIVAVSNELYEQKLAEQLAASKNSIIADPSKKPYLLGTQYVNDAEKQYPDNAEDEDDYFYKLKFPSVLDNQVDICLIRDYATYSQFVSNGYLHSLTSYVTSESATYPRIKKIIKNELIDSLIVDKNLYAIPNNRDYAKDEFQFILIDKKLAEDAGVNVDVNSISSIVDCGEIIKKIGALNAQGVVPFVGNETTPGISFWGEGSSLVVSNNGSTVGEAIYRNEAYLDYTLLYKQLQELNYVKPALVEGEKAGVTIYNGTLAGAQALEQDYYIVKTGTPVLREEEVFGSMFAITDFSINYDRAMMVLYALNTNAEIRTILQYGIEDVDYVLDRTENENDPIIKVVRDENGKALYDMNNDYTGNGYITYREDGAVIDDWTYIKNVNYDAKISKFLHMQSNYDAKRTDEEKAQDKAVVDSMNAFATEIYAEINAMSATDFEAFVVASKLLKKIDDGKAEYDSLKNKTQLTADEKAKVDAYEQLLSQKELADNNQMLQKLYTSEGLTYNLNYYNSLISAFNN